MRTKYKSQDLMFSKFDDDALSHSYVGKICQLCHELRVRDPSMI